MLDAVIPNLKVEGMVRGPKAAGIDLRFLLYKGGASLEARWGLRKLESGQLGRPLMERLPLLQAIHQRWQEAIWSKSLSDSTIDGEWGAVRRVASFADSSNEPFTLDNAMRAYLAWAAQLGARRDLKLMSRYSLAADAARVIASALEIDSKQLLWKTKIRKPRKVGTSGAKENLEETGAFILLMLETIQQLPDDVIRGPLPVVLRYGEVEYQIPCGKNPWKPIDSLLIRKPHQLRDAIARRERASQDVSNTKRAMLINLRLEAEMLVFINQTSCNLTQALQLTGGKFRYQSAGAYVWVLPWKKRAKHAVELRIEKGYRPQFEAFLKWREAIFPGDPEGLTFPFVYNDGDLTMQRTKWGFDDSRRLCKALGKPFVPPTQHRDTVGNFVKRRSSRQLAAEVLSNDGKTFQEHYEAADHQRAAAELVNFWDTMESIVGDAVGPGGCQEARPTPLLDAPKAAPKPDCESESGCLFCLRNRDLRSFDHAWNLASFRHLKLLEFNADRTGLSLKPNHPVLVTVERAAAKLDAMAHEDADCGAWVEEARLRVQEGRYHPHYTAKFEALEGDA